MQPGTRKMRFLSVKREVACKALATTCLRLARSSSSVPSERAAAQVDVHSPMRVRCNLLADSDECMFITGDECMFITLRSSSRMAARTLLLWPLAAPPSGMRPVILSVACCRPLAAGSPWSALRRVISDWSSFLGEGSRPEGPSRTGSPGRPCSVCSAILLTCGRVHMCAPKAGQANAARLPASRTRLRACRAPRACQ